MDLGRRGRMALRCIVYPIVNSFTQATQLGIALQPPQSVEEEGLLKVAAVAANPHSVHRQLQAPLRAKNGAAPLVLGVNTWLVLIATPERRPVPGEYHHAGVARQRAAGGVVLAQVALAGGLAPTTTKPH